MILAGSQSHPALDSARRPILMTWKWVSMALLAAVGVAFARSSSRAEDAGASAPSVSGFVAVDIEGQPHVLGGRALDRPAALVFLGTDCPISRRAIPSLHRIAEEARKAGVDFYGVVSDPFTTRAKARAHAKEFAIGFPVLFDASGDLAKRLAPTHVPEAFVASKEGWIVYRGAIDDRMVDLGKERAQASRLYLADAIAAAAAGKPPAEASSQAIGCIFEGWERVGAAVNPTATRKTTYTRDVVPLLRAHCVVCHRQGEVAPFTLESYTDAAQHARQIARVTRLQLMPPWPPGSTCGKFLDDPSLTEDEVLRLAAWAEAGAPEGDPDDLPPPLELPRGWKLGEPDLVLTMPDAFDVPAEGRDIFRCFVLSTVLDGDRQVVAVDFHPGAKSVVHHALFFLDTAGAARKLDAQDPAPGYRSFGGIGFFPSGGLGGFAPGAQPRRLPDGTFRRLPKGADVVLQVHYHPSGKPERDQSSIALYFADRPLEKEVTGLAILTRDIDIPAGEPKYARHASLTLPAPVSIIGTAPHMHYLGKEMTATATTPDGRNISLVCMKDWNFNWQGQYIYAHAIELPAGTRIDVDATYDNSAGNPRNPSSPPRRVKFGEETTDEMCICFFQITTRNAEERQLIRIATLRALWGK